MKKSIDTCYRALLVFLILSVSFVPLHAQFVAGKTRVLFLLDGSGSMNSLWKDKTKFETAKDILYHLADSLERNDPRLEFGVRVFGHQHPRSENNCNDTRLEVPFAPKNAATINERLQSLKPQGHTPIALSLKEAAADFPKEAGVNNVIILITDGIENCDGLPCNSVDLLVKNRIALKPYIIGLSNDDAFERLFPCKEKFYQAASPEDLNQTAGLVISQALQPTTAQLNLLDKKGQATISNLPLTFYDHFSHQPIYQLVHATHNNGKSDTLSMDPRGIYDLVIHTVPPIRKTSIELEPGRHNVIAVDVPLGGCELQYKKGIRPNPLDPLKEMVVYQSYNSSILSTQLANDTALYLSDDYDLEILAKPLLHRKLFWVERMKNKNLTIPADGTLVAICPEAGHLALFTMQQEQVKMVWQTENCETREELKVQPGRYWMVYRTNRLAESDFTKTRLVEVFSEKQALVKF